MTSRPRATLRRALTSLLAVGVVGGTLTALATPAQAEGAATISGELRMGRTVTVSPTPAHQNLGGEGTFGAVMLYYTASTPCTGDPANDYFRYAASSRIGLGETSVRLEAERSNPRDVYTAVRYDWNGPHDSSQLSDCYALLPADPFETGPKASFGGAAVAGRTLTASAGAADIVPQPQALDLVWAVEGGRTSTASTFTPETSEIGKKLTLTATAYDPMRTPAVSTTSATITSALTSSWTGTAKVAEKLTANAPESGSASYEWFANGSSIATTREIVVDGRYVGQSLTLRTTVTQDGQSQSATSSAATIVQSDVPTITGDLRMGKDITISPKPGPNRASFVFFYKADQRCGTADAGVISTQNPGHRLTFPLLADENRQVRATYTEVRYAWWNGAQHVYGPCYTLGEPEAFTSGPKASFGDTALAGRTLTAATGTISPDPMDTAYSWKVDGVERSTAKTYRPTGGDVGKKLTLAVTAYDVFRKTETSTSEPVTITSDLTSSWTGTTTVGETLTARTPGFVPEGEKPTYTWFLGRGDERTKLAEGQTLVLERSTGGTSLSLTTTLDGESVVSEYVTVGKLAFEPAPTLTSTGEEGAPVTGDTLTAGEGPGLPSGTDVTYAWARVSPDSAASATCEDAKATTPPTDYEVTNADAGQELCVEVTYEAEGYETTSRVLSAGAATGTFADASVSIDGTPTVGESSAYTLSGLDPDAESTSTVWEVDGKEVGTGPTYEPEPTDLGKDLTVTVTSSKAAYEDEVSASEAEEVVLGTFDAGKATITGVAKVGEVLTRNAPKVETPAGTTYSYRWGVQLQGEEDCLAIGATAATLRLSADSKGAQFCVITTASAPGYHDDVTVSDLSDVVVGGDLTVWRPSIDDTTPVVAEELTASVDREGYPEGADVRFTWGHQEGRTCSTEQLSRSAGEDDGSSYTVKPADVAAKLCVTVTVSAKGYETDSASSRPTAVVEKATFAKASLSVDDTTPVFGETLEASIEREGALPEGAATMAQWGTVDFSADSEKVVCDPIEDGEGSVFEIADPDLVGATLCVSATTTAPGYETEHVGPVTVGRVAAKANPVTEAELSDTTPTFGDELTVDLTGTPNEKGDVSYQWGHLDQGDVLARNAVGTCEPLDAGNASDGTHAVGLDDLGEVLCAKVVVSEPGHEEFSTTLVADEQTALKANPVTKATLSDATPTFGDVLKVALTGTPNEKADVSYDWGTVPRVEVLRGGSESCSSLDAPDQSSYQVPSGAVGTTLCVTVTVSEPGYEMFSTTLTAEKPTAAKTFTGGSVAWDVSPQVDRASTAKLSGLTPASEEVSYVWKVAGEKVATTASYTPTLAQVGKPIEVMVGATKDGYTPFTKTVSGTVGVPGKGLVVPSMVGVGERFVVTATGLKPGQSARVLLSGRSVWTGKADAAGRVVRQVTFPKEVAAGKRRVRVSGYTTTKGRASRTYTVSTTVSLSSKIIR